MWPQQPRVSISSILTLLCRSIIGTPLWTRFVSTRPPSPSSRRRPGTASPLFAPHPFSDTRSSGHGNYFEALDYLGKWFVLASSPTPHSPFLPSPLPSATFVLCQYQCSLFPHHNHGLCVVYKCHCTGTRPRRPTLLPTRSAFTTRAGPQSMTCTPSPLPHSPTPRPESPPP